MAAETRHGRRRFWRRLLVAPAVVAATAGAGAALYAFSSGLSAPKQVSYRGRMYMGVVEVTPIEARANFGRLRPSGTSIGDKPLFVAAGSPPAVVAVRLSDGHFNAYQLMR